MGNVQKDYIKCNNYEGVNDKGQMIMVKEIVN